MTRNALIRSCFSSLEFIGLFGGILVAILIAAPRYGIWVAFALLAIWCVAGVFAAGFAKAVLLPKLLRQEDQL